VSITETLLTFVAAPALIFAVISLAALGPSQMRAPARYRPGRAWPHEPAWFLPHAAAAASAGGSAEHGDHDGPGELTGHTSAHNSANAGPVGGASGEW
jgi:hypothetical protein